jgi:AcrR family transcriptional regulator
MIAMKQASQTTIKIGRPRAFIHEEALNEAMLAFWEYGFETTSMSLLAKRMNMNAPSIYATFGDKKNLFLKALDKYVGNLADIKTFIDQSPSAFDAANNLLQNSAKRFTEKNTPNGCMLASSIATGSAESADVQAIASKIRSRIEGFLKDRIQRDQENKILPKSVSSEGLAGLTISTIQGMSVLARDGASRKKLLQIVDAAMLAWPS